MYYTVFILIITLFLQLTLCNIHPHFNDLKEIANSYPGKLNWDINNENSDPCSWERITCVGEGNIDTI